MRLITFIMTSLLFLTPALAQESDPPPRALAGGHLAGAYLSGLLGEVAMGTLGAQVGLVLAGDCYEPPDDDTFLGDCFLHGIGEAVIGGLIGMNVGAPLGVYTYGAATGHRGSYGWATAGSVVGTLAGIGLATLIEEEQTGLIIMGLMVPAGALLGYQLGAPTGDDAPATALLDVSPERGLRLGVPTVRWARRDDDSRWFVNLMSGRF